MPPNMALDNKRTLSNRYMQYIQLASKCTNALINKFLKQIVAYAYHMVRNIIFLRYYWGVNGHCSP